MNRKVISYFLTAGITETTPQDKIIEHVDIMIQYLDDNIDKHLAKHNLYERQEQSTLNNARSPEIKHSITALRQNNIYDALVHLSNYVLRNRNDEEPLELMEFWTIHSVLSTISMYTGSRVAKL